MFSEKDQTKLVLLTFVLQWEKGRLMFSEEDPPFPSFPFLRFFDPLKQLVAPRTRPRMVDLSPCAAQPIDRGFGQTRPGLPARHGGVH